MVLYPGVSLEMTKRAASPLIQHLMASPVRVGAGAGGRGPGDCDGAGG